MLLAELVKTSQGVASTRKRLEKIERIADCLGHLETDEIVIAVGFLKGEPRQGRIGVGPALARESLATPAAAEAALSLRAVDAALDRIREHKGRGVPAERVRLVQELMRRATDDEQHFLARLLIGELRQGALEGLVIESIARAASLPPADVRRAVMLAGDAGAVAAVALTTGGSGLAGFGLETMRAIQPMLAQPAADVAAAVGLLGEAAIEWKIDGARVQVHKRGDEVRVFTRRLNEVTLAVPEIVETMRSLPAADLILDGEVIALRDDGTPHPFQTTMRRFGRKLDVERSSGRAQSFHSPPSSSTASRPADTR